MKDFNQLIAELKKMTENNHHTESLIAIAEYYKLWKYLKIFEGVLTIVNAEGHLPEKISAYRYEQYQNLLEHIKVYHPADYKAVYNSL